MASSNSHNGDLSEKEVEGEEEYEEIEVEEEVEEEIEVEEEVEEEIEVEVEEEDGFEEENFEEEEEEPQEVEEEGGTEEDEAKEVEEGEEEEPELDEDEEYEEEFEEVEVEEEVTDDEEDATMADAECEGKGDEDIKDAAIAVAKSDLSSIPLIADNLCEDGRQHVEAEGDEKGDRKGISSIDVGTTKSSKLLEHITGPQRNAVNYEQGLVEQASLISASEKYVSASDAESDHQIGKQDTTDVEESKRPPEEADLHLPSRQNVDQKESRSWFPQVRLRSSSPGAEREDGNKRAALVCDYFAKGWCIKGSSCRFLHKRDNIDNATQVGDTLPRRNDLQPSKGCGDNAYASELLVYKGSSSTAGKDIQKEHGERLNLPQYKDKDETGLLERAIPLSLVSADSQKSSSREEGSRSISNPREVADGFEKYHSNHGLSVAEGGSMLHDKFFPWRGSSSRELGVASGSSSILRLIEESAAMRRRYSLDIQSRVPSYMSSWKSNSLLHKSPLSSGSDSAKFSGTNYAQDQLTSFKYKTTFTPYNWEPSVPFRSSYFISAVNRSADVQYDPFRDSIQQPDVAHPSFRDSSYSQTQGIHNISGQNSIELHRDLQFNNWKRNYSLHDKVVPEIEAESAATSASDAQNKMVEEENPTIPGSVKDILKASRSSNDGNSKFHIDLFGNGDLKVEKGRQNNELDDGESKTIKIFRASLIEFVKELMKPLWHGGQLSKDVYKVIVQKAEDKILSTLQPNQVPSSSEAIKQYLVSSRPKILKLIQAYVDKYGRF